MHQSQESTPVDDYGLEETSLWTEWVRVDSSNIGAVRYSGFLQKMQVAFNTGARYEYDDVEASTYENFINAPSKGKFFYHAVRQFGYTYRQI